MKTSTSSKAAKNQRKIWNKFFEYQRKKKKERKRNMKHMGQLKGNGILYWNDPEGWYGEGGGSGVQDWEHVYTHGGFMLMYGKTKNNIVK